jgi:hypothetical protein
MDDGLLESGRGLSCLVGVLETNNNLLRKEFPAFPRACSVTMVETCMIRCSASLSAAAYLGASVHMKEGSILTTGV